MFLKTLLGCLLVGAVAHAAPVVPSQSEMIQGLNTIQQAYQTQYAMLDWKVAHLGFDLQREFDNARAQVQANPNLSLRDYQRLIKNILSDMNDYHVSIAFERTEKAYLPLTIRSAEGRYFVAYIDRSQLSTTVFPFQVGDEVLQFGKNSVAQEIQAIRKIYYGGNDGTDQALAEILLTHRAGSMGLDVPQGPITLTLKSSTTGVIRDVQLIWNYFREEIASNAVPAFLKADDGLTHLSMHKEMSWGAQESFKDLDDPFSGIGLRTSYIPDLGTKIWESDPTTNFHAYIFRTAANHLIGYIRIPHYEGNAAWIAEFAGLIAKMQPTTDALVLDEINNPGGSVFYLYTLASLLTQQTMFTPPHQMKITASDVAEAIQSRNSLAPIKNDDDARAQVVASDFDGYPISFEFVQFARTFYSFIISQWNIGNTLTDPTFVYGADRVNPYPGVTYSKPILLVINQLDFSGGDFFPSIMQDNKRVTVFGTRTAGAGGYILQQKYSNNLGIDHFSITGSIAHRLGGEPIENLAVTPDISYDLTAADFTSGFVPYKNAIVNAVEGLIK